LQCLASCGGNLVSTMTDELLSMVPLLVKAAALDEA
jgi:hypothetical protein